MQTIHYKNSFFFIIFAPQLINQSFQVKLHIFNPEHDIALAYDKCSITLPHAIQEFKANLSFLPALWADDGDCVLTDDIPFALKSLKQTRKPHADVLFLNTYDIKNFSYTEICPWGWDKNLKAQLSGCGIDAKLLPSDDTLLSIKTLSSRAQTTKLLEYLRNGIEPFTCGENLFADDMHDLRCILNKYGQAVVKAPWSSSGRGLRYISSEKISASLSGWMQNVIKSQGGIMVEPYYNRLRDFAMEFYSHENGTVDYLGLSVFNTDKGCYTGNIIAPESSKQAAISRYIPEEVLFTVRQRAISYFSELLKGIYRGPFGIDMMVVSGENGIGYLLHPCVEINLRMTMGHVANRFGEASEELMKIVHDVNYKLKFETLENYYVKVL